MQSGFFQTAEYGMKTRKFLQGNRKKTLLGELHNRVSAREIERTIKLETDISSFYIARVIYDKLKERACKETFDLLRFGIIRSIIIQTQYELEIHEETFKRKIILNLYEKEQAAIKIKSPPVRTHKKVKVKEESKFFIPYINGKKPDKDIQEVFEENISRPLKEGNSWEKEKYQIFVECGNNIFTISVSQIYMLQVKDDLLDGQSKVPLRRIEVEYQGTRCSDLSGNVQTEEGKESEKPDVVEVEKKVEKEIIKQTRKISQRVLGICKNELCLPLITV
jgi:hypothetical protein